MKQEATEDQKRTREERGEEKEGERRDHEVGIESTNSRSVRRTESVREIDSGFRDLDRVREGKGGRFGTPSAVDGEKKSQSSQMFWLGRIVGDPLEKRKRRGKPCFLHQIVEWILGGELFHPGGEAGLGLVDRQSDSRVRVEENAVGDSGLGILLENGICHLGTDGDGQCER
jgi:hypothetical protein